LYDNVTLESLLEAKKWLADKGIISKPVFGRDGSEPIVHASDPAAAIYFDDPDGNELELYARIPGVPRVLESTAFLSEWSK